MLEVPLPLSLDSTAGCLYLSDADSIAVSETMAASSQAAGRVLVSIDTSSLGKELEQNRDVGLTVVDLVGRHGFYEVGCRIGSGRALRELGQVARLGVGHRAL